MSGEILLLLSEEDSGQQEPTEFLLLESGGFLLLESGGKLGLE